MFKPSRCEIIPCPHDQAAFLIEGREVTRWHFGKDAPRPYFYPLLGPRSRQSLTRMGHPGAPNHDHHRSVWFAHHELLGIDFWSDQTDARIRQRRWYAYQDGENASMAVLLDWLDGHDPQPLVEQELIVTLQPLPKQEYLLLLQSTFRPRAESIEFQQTNYGFFAVRLAKSLSVSFGSGTITNSEGAVGEAAVFGRPARWVDYSGPLAWIDPDGQRHVDIEGVTYMDHPANVSFPSKWHVREDGWMGACACRDQGCVTTRSEPLQLSYLLYIHHGKADPQRADQILKDWSQQPKLRIQPSRKKHQQFEIVPVEAGSTPAS